MSNGNSKCVKSLLCVRHVYCLCIVTHLILTIVSDINTLLLQMRSWATKRLFNLPKVIQRQSGIGMDAIFYFHLKLWCFLSNFLFWKCSKVQRIWIVQWTPVYLLSLDLTIINIYHIYFISIYVYVWSWHFSICPGQGHLQICLNGILIVLN